MKEEVNFSHQTWLAKMRVRSPSRRLWRLVRKRFSVAFSDPQSVTINAVAKTLPRVDTGSNRSTYRMDDGTVTLTASHVYGKRKRSLLRLDFQKTAPDPLISSTNIVYSMSVQLVVDRPLVGFTVAEQKQIVDAMSAYLTASSGANTTKFLGGEN